MSLTYQMSLPLTTESEETGHPLQQPPIDEILDVTFVDEMATYESYNKHLYRPNTYLHKWWARRCGSTFRAILKHLAPDPALRDYYKPGGLQGILILDPMMGGGTTLHEALRLGANVIGADIDPIPILQARASLTQIPLKDLETGFEALYRTLYRQLSPLFQTACPECGKKVDLQYTLYASRQMCECREVWIVDSKVLRYNTDGSKIQICEHCHAITDKEICNCAVDSKNPPIIEKHVKKCDICNSEFQELVHLPFYQRYIPIAIIGQCPNHGLFFASPTSEDRNRIDEANQLRLSLDFNSNEFFKVSPGPKSQDLINHKVHNYLDLFSSRQLLYLDYAIRGLQNLDAPIRLNLALLVSTSLEFNTMLCGYKGGGKRRPGAVRHAFSYHAYTFPYTALENNPAFPTMTSGTLQSLYHYRIRRARRWAQKPKERNIENDKVSKVTIAGEVDAGIEVKTFEKLQTGDHRFLLMQGSSTHLDLPTNSIDYIVTDPPYFDSVQYSDLAAFFRVWLQVLIPDTARWTYDMSQSAVDPQANGSGQYTSALSGIFAECNRVLKPELGRLIFTYHHWNPKGWAALTKALKAGNFHLLNHYTVHAENPTSVHISNLKALKHDSILIFADKNINRENKWQKPEPITATESRQFCTACSDTLGWILNQEMSDQEIDNWWTTILPY